MMERWTRAVAAGTAVGVILQEGIWAGFSAIDPGASLNHGLVAADGEARVLLPLLFSWIVGGAAGGLMAALVGRGAAAGHAAGALLSLSALVLCGLAWPEAGALLTIAAAPSLGAAFGAGAGRRILTDDGAAPARPGVVTLRRP